MWRKVNWMVLAAAWAALALNSAQAEITMDMVTVGNAGNAPDPTTGWGSLGYAYQIGKYEVTAGQYTAFLNAVASTDTYWLYNTRMSNAEYASGITQSGGGTSGDPYTYTVNSAFVNRPVNYVSWGDAVRFVNWLSNGQPRGAQGLATTEDGSYYLNGATSDTALGAVTRKASATWVIPTTNEWYKAAYHKNDGVTGDYFMYPTSNDSPPGRDMTDASGNNANCYGPGPDPIDSGKYYTTVVGQFQKSASPYGTFDQGGNVMEWHEAGIGGSFGLRGGAFDDPSTELLMYNGFFYVPPTYEESEFGFRVASSEAVPEPGSVAALLGMAVMGLIWRRRRK